MRLLHVAERLSDRGGAYTHMLAVLQELSRAHDVTLAVGRREGVDTPCPTVVWRGLDERADVPVPELEALTRVDDGTACPQGAAADPRGVAQRHDRQPKEVLGAGRFDVLHVHNVVNPAVLRWAASAGRAVVTVQDHRFFCPGRGKWRQDGAPCRAAFCERACRDCFDDPAYFQEILALTRARFDSLRHLPVIVLSEYMRGELVQAGLDPRRVHVIPPFVHGLDGQAKPDGPPCVAFVGRLAETKGVRDGIAAWKRAAVGLPLVFAGTGPLRGELEREGFEVLGWIDRGRLSALYKRSRAVLLPSRWQEPFGIVGAEAAAMGTRVVAWDSGGVGEWYRGEHVAWGDVDGLAEALRRAVAPPGEDARLEPAAAFDRRDLMERLLRIYEEVSAASQTPRAS